jgi:hypothetical protein
MPRNKYERESVFLNVIFIYFQLLLVFLRFQYQAHHFLQALHRSQDVNNFQIAESNSKESQDIKLDNTIDWFVRWFFW